MVDGKVAFTWSLADYGVMTQVNYSLEAAVAAAPEARVTITSGITADAAAFEAGKITSEVDYETLNAILFNDLGLADGVAEDVNFYIGAKVGEYAKIYSNAVTVSCKVTAAEKQYPKLTVAGSYAYNNWTPGKGQFVFDFEGTDAKYSGVIDFGEDVSALQFKFVGEAWGNNEFSVPAGEAQAPEAAELPLVAGGGDNIAAYTTHRYYSLTLDKTTPKVIKNFSFNSLGVIGDATPTGWDADTDMQFNPEKQRFYVDLTLIDGKIKFRADDAWDVNWGGADGALSAGGADIAVTAGDYRIYVNLNDPANPTYELNAKMFGKDEARFHHIEELIDGDVIKVDYIKSNHGVSLNTLSTGLDSNSVAKMNDYRALKFLGDTIPYMLGILYSIFVSPTHEYQVTLDGKSYTDKFAEVFIGNGCIFGGNMFFDEHTCVDDGKAIFRLVENRRGFPLLPALMAVTGKKYSKLPNYMECGDCSTIRIRRTDGAPFTINQDGDLIYNVTDCEAQIVRKGLRFVVPKGVTVA